MSNSRDVLSPQPPESSGNTCLILGLVFGGFGGFVLLCGGCCGFGVWFSFGEIERQTRTDLANNAVIQEHVGTIQTFKIDFMESINKSSDGEEDTFVFDIAGDKGSGTIVAEVLNSDVDGSLYVASGQLTMDSGEVYELMDGSVLPGGIEIDGEFEMPETITVDPAATDALLEAENAEFTRKVQAAVAANPVLMERIGDISSFAYDLVQSNAEPGMDVYVFQVTGSKGSGKLRAECITLDEQTEGVSSAELILDSGESAQLFPDSPLQ